MHLYTHKYIVISIASIEIWALAFHLLPFNCYEILINSIKLQKRTRKDKAYFIIVREFNHGKRVRERERKREMERGSQLDWIRFSLSFLSPPFNTRNAIN